MLNAQDFDSLLVDFAEQGALIAAAEAELGTGRLEPDHVAGAGLQAVSRSMPRSSARAVADQIAIRLGIVRIGA